MPDPPFLQPLLSVLRDLTAWLKANEVQGVIIGGVAASLLGRPRLTRDVDAVVWLDEDRWSEFLASGKGFSFVPRRPDALEFARQTRVLVVRHEPVGIDADISFGALPFEKEVIEGAEWVELSGVRLPIPTPENLIIMKAVAHRPRDLADIESLVDAHPDLDRRRVRRWVREFATVLEMPEILTDLDARLSP